MITYAIVAACFVFCAVYNGMPGGSSLIKGLFVPICAYVIMAVSLNLTVGILGELSLGHAGFMCLGAFVGSTFSILTQESLTSVWIRFPLAILIGAAILLFTGVASWRTMVSVFVGGLAMGYLFQALGVTTYPAWWHLIVGGFAFGAVFMATDYSTSPMTVRGGVIYAVGIGVITMCIRLWGAYPEGMSFAILVMNATVPLINRSVKPKRFGAKK